MEHTDLLEMSKHHSPVGPAGAGDDIVIIQFNIA